MKKIVSLLLLLTSFTGFAQERQVQIELNDSTRLVLVQAPFDATGKDIVYWNESKDAISSIDGMPVYGTDATMPQNVLQSATLFMGDKKYALDVSGMYDPLYHDPEVTPQFVLNKFMGNPARLRGGLGIAAGHYYVEWTITGERSFRTILTYDWEFLCDEETFLRQQGPVDKRGIPE